MASILRIKRSETAGNPSTLGAGELAYSGLADTGSNGGDRLYIGMGTETAGNAVNHVIIGGKYYTDLLSGTAGTLNTASKSVPILSINGAIDQWLPGNLKLTANTLSSTNTNGDITISPNGTGKTVVSNLYIGDSLTSLSEFIFDTVGGAITAGTGITVTNSDSGNTSTISISDSGVVSGSYGSSTSIPSITVNSQGQITGVSTYSIATSLNISGDTGSDTVALATDTLEFIGGVGLTSTITNNTVTLDIDSTVVTTSGTQTLTNKTWNSNIIDIAYGGTGTSNGSITGSGVLTFTAGTTGNNNINLVPLGTGTVDVASKRITSVADPIQAQDAATKSYVDAVKTGLNVKDSVRLATTTALTVTYSNGTSGVGATLTNAGTQAALTLDSVPVVAGDRVLVKDQAAALQNGIYIVINIGSASTNWVLSRTTDFDNNPSGEVAGGDFVFVQAGTTQADNGYVVTTDGTITVGTTGITWAQFSGAGQITAGNGLSKSGNTLSVLGTTNRITVSGTGVDIASTYVGQTTITTLGTIATGTWQGTLLAGQYGGTGVNNSGKTITLGGNISTGGALTLSGAFATTLTVTAATTLTLPTTGTLATLAGTESLSNKTITLSSFSGTTISASGAISFSNTTASTSTTSGALVVTGGVGIGGAVYIGGAINIASTTTSSSATTGALVVAGGMGVSNSVYLGANLTGAGASLSSINSFNIDGGTY